MINPKEKKVLVKRLHYIKGQLGGIEKMLDDDRSVKDIYGQLKAVEQALHQALYVVLDDQIKRQFAEALAQRLGACSGDCDDAKRLQFLRHEFSKLDLKELIDELAWLHDSRRSTQTNNSKSRKEVKTK
jgi:DNA-binding FrmR family transcriptional regulator